MNPIPHEAPSARSPSSEFENPKATRSTTLLSRKPYATSIFTVTASPAVAIGNYCADAAIVMRIEGSLPIIDIE